MGRAAEEIMTDPSHTTTLTDGQLTINVTVSPLAITSSGELVEFSIETSDAPDQLAVGTVTLHITDGIAALSYTVGSDDGGSAIATDAVKLAIDWAFEQSGVEAISWQGVVGDYGYWRVAWANGFTFEGTFRGSLPNAAGRPLAAWHATLLKDDAREPKTQWLEAVRLEAVQPERVGVVLRDFVESDQERALETLNDPESMLWLGTIPMPRTPEAFQSMLPGRLLGATLGRALTWTVADPDTDKYLASVSLFNLDDLDYKSGEVGYRTHPDARGRGVLAAALRAVITHAFTPLDEGGVGLDRISLLAGDGNLASIGVARSCGFTEVGRDRHCYDLNDGRVVDLIRFDLLRSEYER
jgi:RimJ/RimL family protein N-acetyltransferase